MNNSTIKIKQEVVPSVPKKDIAVIRQGKVNASPLPGMESTSSFEHLMQLVHCLRKERDAAHLYLARLKKEHADSELSRSSTDAWQQQLLDMLQDLATTTKHSLDKHCTALEAQEGVLKATSTELVDQLRKLTERAMQVKSDELRQSQLAATNAKKLAVVKQKQEEYKAESKQLRASCTQLQNSNAELEQKYKDVVAREHRVRSIAIKYKMQFDELQSQVNALQGGAPAESLKRALQDSELGQAAKQAKTSEVPS